MSHDFSELQMGLQNNFNTCIISIITKPVSWCIHTLPWCPLASVCCLIEAGRNRKRTAAMSNQATIIIIRVELEPSVAASGCNPNAKHNKSSHILYKNWLWVQIFSFEFLFINRLLQAENLGKI